MGVVGLVPIILSAYGNSYLRKSSNQSQPQSQPQSGIISTTQPSLNFW